MSESGGRWNRSNEDGCWVDESKRSRGEAEYRYLDRGKLEIEDWRGQIDGTNKAVRRDDRDFETHQETATP